MEVYLEILFLLLDSYWFCSSGGTYPRHHVKVRVIVWVPVPYKLAHKRRGKQYLILVGHSNPHSYPCRYLSYCRRGFRGADTREARSITKCCSQGVLWYA
jgi:hypothetical protein